MRRAPANRIFATLSGRAAGDASSRLSKSGKKCDDGDEMKLYRRRGIE